MLVPERISPPEASGAPESRLPVIELWPVPILGQLTLFAVGVAEAEIPVPDGLHLQLAAAVLRVVGAETEAVDVLGQLHQQMVVDK